MIQRVRSPVNSYRPPDAEFKGYEDVLVQNVLAGPLGQGLGLVQDEHAPAGAFGSSPLVKKVSTPALA